MRVEPKVFEAIRHNRREVRSKKLLLITPFALGLLICLLLILVPLATGKVSPGYDRPGGKMVYDVVCFFFASILFSLSLGLGWIQYRNVQYARKRFGDFVEDRTVEFEPHSLSKFMDALGGVSIAAGIEEPNVVILDDPQVNALAFQDSNGATTIGITRGALDAGVPVGEANSMMAHEVAHTMIGDNVRPPGVLDFEFLPGLLLFPVALMATIGTLPMDIHIGISDVALAFIFFGIAVVLTTLELSKSYRARLLEASHHHDDILADSIAVKITRDPQSLIDAIKRVDAQAKETGRSPGGVVIARYVFVSPQFVKEKYRSDVSSVTASYLDLFNSLFKREDTLVKKRLLNLEFIQQGRWRAFEDWY